MAGTDNLFEPIKVGKLTLAHRIVMAPLTRTRADPFGVPSEHAAEYYAQRAQYPGTLIIGEAAPVHPKVGNPAASPSINTDAQIARWREVVYAVHAKKSFIFHQLWAVGKQPPADSRIKRTLLANYEGGHFRERHVNDYTLGEIKQVIQWFADSAYNAVFKAGFDGVEVHGANGYLLEQFLRKSSNQRTDEYGGSIENRTLLARQVLDAVIERLGGDASLVGFRISPWSNPNGTQQSSQTVAEYAYLLSYFQDRYPELAYVSVVEPRLAYGHADDAAVPAIPGLQLEEWNLFVRLVWKGIIIRAGGIVPHAQALANKDPKVLIAIGRYFISNPDIVHRIKNDIPLTPYHRPTFYTPGPEGYIDYPNAAATP